MGEGHSTCHSISNNGTKQIHKRWNILRRKSETKREKESLDLDIINPEIPSSVMSWNCHHKLEEIKRNLIQFKSKFEQTQSPKSKLSKTKSKSLNDLMIISSKHRFVILYISSFLSFYVQII